MRRLPTLFACVVLSGCASLPKDLPKRPEMLRPEAGQALSAQGVKVAANADVQAREPWWQAFGLPELNRLEKQALQSNPDLVVAQARLASASSSEKLAQLQTSVHYSTDAGVTRQRFSENGIFPPPIGGSTFTDFSVNQSFGYNLDLFGRESDLVDAAHAQTAAARSARDAARLTLSAAVADTYFDWAGIRTQLKLANEIERRHQQELDLAQTAFKLGLTGIGPIHQGRQVLDEDADRIRSLDYQDRAARYRLAALLGLDPDHAAQLAAPDELANAPVLPSTLHLDALSYRPDVASQRAIIENAKAESAAARADFYPNIDLKALVGLDSLDLGKLLNSGSLAFSIGPALHLPLFNTHTLQARLGMREAEVDAAIGQYNHSVLEAARQVVDSYALNVSLDQRLSVLDHALGNTRDLSTISRQRRDFGLARPIDAIKAELEVLNRELQLSQLHAAQLRARVVLAAALGGETRAQKE